jgi:hypothetical protein
MYRYIVTTVILCKTRLQLNKYNKSNIVLPLEGTYLHNIV